MDDAGKPTYEAELEVTQTANAFRYFSELADKMHGEVNETNAQPAQQLNSTTHLLAQYQKKHRRYRTQIAIWLSPIARPLESSV